MTDNNNDKEQTLENVAEEEETIEEECVEEETVEESEEDVAEEEDADEEDDDSQDDEEIPETEDADKDGRRKKKPAQPHGKRNSVIRAIKNYPHWVAQTFHDWLNGTEEKPLPFLGLRDRFKCWRMIRSGRYVYLRVLTFDRRTKWWNIKEDLIPRREMPAESVHCTNEKGTHLLPLENIKYDPREDYGFGAHNAFNYMRDNSFEDAQMAVQEEKKGLPLKYLGVILVGGIAIMMYMVTMMQ